MTRSRHFFASSPWIATGTPDYVNLGYTSRGLAKQALMRLSPKSLAIFRKLGLDLFEKSKIDGVGHGAVAKIVRLGLVSRGKTRQHSLGVIRLVREQLDPVGVRPPEPGYNFNTSMAVSA